MTQLKDLSRMIIWLAIGLTLYLMAYAVGNSQPTLQVVCQKLGNVTTAAWIGYWIARVALGRLKADGTSLYPSTPNEMIARAIIILAAILGVSMGL